MHIFNLLFQLRQSYSENYNVDLKDNTISKNEYAKSKFVYVKVTSYQIQYR